MNKYTFTVTEIQGEYGHHYPLLTSNEYPWMNCQIIPTPPSQYQQVMDELHRRHEMIAVAAGRTDFCAIQTGGGTPEHPTIPVTPENYAQVGAALRECLQAAADFWAASSPLPASSGFPTGDATVPAGSPAVPSDPAL